MPSSPGFGPASASRGAPAGPDSGAASPGKTVVASALLGVAIVVPLAVFLYARTEPALGGIPFFFWFQFALIPVAALATTLAYRLLAVRDRERRASARTAHARRTRDNDRPTGSDR